MSKVKLKLAFQSAAVVLVGSLILAAVPVLAENDNSGTSASTSESSKEAAKKEAEAQKEAAKKEFERKKETAKKEFEKKKEAAKQKFEEKREAAKSELEAKKEKLKDEKLKICNEREDKINKHMDTVASRGQSKLDLFTKIAERVKSFYVSKGKTLSNYEDLVAAVNAKKASAQATVDAVISHSVTFDCDGDDPKGAAGGFKSKVKDMNSALKEYRTAVKNLIVGVKSVQSSTEGEN